MHGEQFRNQLTRLINDLARAWADAQSTATPPNRRLTIGRRTARANALRRLKKHNPQVADLETTQNDVVSAAALNRAANAAVRLTAARMIQELDSLPGGIDNRSLAKAEAYQQARREVLRQLGSEEGSPPGSATKSSPGNKRLRRNWKPDIPDRDRRFKSDR